MDRCPILLCIGNNWYSIIFLLYNGLIIFIWLIKSYTSIIVHDIIMISYYKYETGYCNVKGIGTNAEKEKAFWYLFVRVTYRNTLITCEIMFL